MNECVMYIISFIHLFQSQRTTARTVVCVMDTMVTGAATNKQYYILCAECHIHFLICMYNMFVITCHTSHLS